MAGVQALESNHPYVPTNLILPDYVPIILSQSTILGVFNSASFLVLSFVWIIAGRFPKISKLDKLLMCWWVFTGLIHMIIEGYYVFTPDFYKQKNPTFLAEVCLLFLELILDIMKDGGCFSKCCLLGV